MINTAQSQKPRKMIFRSYPDVSGTRKFGGSYDIDGTDEREEVVNGTAGERVVAVRCMITRSSLLGSVKEARLVRKTRVMRRGGTA